MLKSQVIRSQWRIDDYEKIQWIKSVLTGYSLNLCCGRLHIGSVNADLDPNNMPDKIVNYHFVEEAFKENEFDTLLFDPPYTDYWKHSLNSMLHRLRNICKGRIIIRCYLFVESVRDYQLPWIKIFIEKNRKLDIFQIYEPIAETGYFDT